MADQARASMGLLPVAAQLGEGGELRAPLAAVIIGGMISSTILTLVFVPVSYTYFDGLQRRIMSLGRRGDKRRPKPALAPTSADTPAAPATNGARRELPAERRPAVVGAEPDGHRSSGREPARPPPSAPRGRR